MYEKIVLITRRTRLDELIDRFNTREQAKFYIEHMGLSFTDYEVEHATYARAVTGLRHSLEAMLKVQIVERQFLPNFIFTDQDIIVTVGQDGLVVNAAKYLRGQPVVAVNPDPQRYDGILLPFTVAAAQLGVINVLEERAAYHEITMAEARLNDGQSMLAFNDFLIGQRTHISARYTLSWRDQIERQSSSGVLITTGAGSTGWFSSTQHMAESIARLLLPEQPIHWPRLRFGWDDQRLAFVVREPFQSRASGVRLTAGWIEAGEALQLESHMPEGGVLFSDGVEADALAFNSGSVATIQAATRTTRLVRAP